MRHGKHQITRYPRMAAWVAVAVCLQLVAFVSPAMAAPTVDVTMSQMVYKPKASSNAR